MTGNVRVPVIDLAITTRESQTQPTPPPDDVIPSVRRLLRSNEPQTYENPRGRTSKVEQTEDCRN